VMKLKGKAIAVAGSSILVGSLVLLAATNPDQRAYEEFATQQLINYGKQNLCPKAPFGLSSQCGSMLEQNRQAIHKLVSENTQRHNYIFFSLYLTDLSISSWLPSYHFETVGALYQFHLYQAREEQP